MSTKTKDKLPHLKHLLSAAILLFIITLGIYFLNFHEGLSTERSDWGTFGDFMGGTLNPIFAIFSLAAILYTIKIQTEELELSRKELEATREELRKSSEAQQEQSESFKIQNDSIKLQSFENTFFQLMNLFLNTREHLKITIFFDSSVIHAGYIDNFIINNQMKEQARGYVERGSRVSIFKEGEYFSYEAIKMYIVLLKKVYKIDYDTFNEKYEGYTGTYCIQIYQMLKYIDNSQIHDKQFYVNLFRA